MHIFFSGIGGTAIGPLALVAKQAGYGVAGSDKQASQYIDYLEKHGVDSIHIGQSYEQIASAHAKRSIDWYVYSSAVAIENPDAPELKFCRDNGIKTSKRDELINLIIKEKKLKMLAIAGTHGKSTTTAMAIWLFKQLGIPVSYSVGAKISFGDMGQYQEGSEYFIYECDEFDRNFLAFYPTLSLITGVTWDHHEVYPTKEDYRQAFRDFIGQSSHTILWKDDFERLALPQSEKLTVLEGTADEEELVNIAGFYNRLDAWLAATGVARLVNKTTHEVAALLTGFPGLQRRMEEIVPGLYSDYAHTPEKIRGGMSVALELCERWNLSQNTGLTSGKSIHNNGVRGGTSHIPGVVVVYEPLTNRRQHYMMDDYGDCFAGSKKVYWIPSYLAREDPNQPVLTPSELITHLADPSIAKARERDESLKQTIQEHLNHGDMVVAMAGGGGGSLDEWIRENFTEGEHKP